MIYLNVKSLLSSQCNPISMLIKDIFKIRISKNYIPKNLSSRKSAILF